jgi:predicted enzyme related to lactoylglutathione lyase
MSRAIAHPVVHLELQTANLPRACVFYTELFGWRAETLRAASATYLALDLGACMQGGMAEREVAPSVWLPYVEVADIAEVTERARLLGAAVTLEPREGPAGWRSLLAPPCGAEVALWQPKT